MATDFPVNGARGGTGAAGFPRITCQARTLAAFTVGPQFGEENAGSQDRIFGLGVFFAPALAQQQRERRNHPRAQAQAETPLHTVRRDIERRVVSASRACETKRAEMAQWRADSTRQFAQAAALADRHYRLGAPPARPGRAAQMAGWPRVHASAQAVMFKR